MDMEGYKASRIQSYFEVGLIESATDCKAKIVKIYQVKRRNEPSYRNCIWSWHGSPLQDSYSFKGIYSSMVSEKAFKFGTSRIDDVHCVLFLLEFRAALAFPSTSNVFVEGKIGYGYEYED